MSAGIYASIDAPSPVDASAIMPTVGYVHTAIQVGSTPAFSITKERVHAPRLVDVDRPVIAS